MSSLDIRSIDTKKLRKAPPPATKQEFRVFLSEAAFDRAVARGDTDTTREIGGVLIGELLCDDAGPYLRIDGTIDALYAEEKGAELTFTHATWEHIHKEMDSKHQDKRVVGWYHTHPGFGIFLSDRDQFIHKSFFNLPFQVALVYDPKSREHGMFTWHDNEVWRARRYWIGPREQAWDGLRAPTEKSGEKSGDKSGDQSGDKLGDADKAGGARKLDDRAPAGSDGGDRSAELGLPGSLVSLALVGLVLLVVGGLVGRWLGVSAANDAIVQAQLEIAKSRSEGSQLAIASLQNELVGILRDTMGDEALRTPILQAVTELDRVIAVLPHTGDAAPNAGPGVAPDAPAEVPPLVAQLQATRDTLLRLGQARGSAATVLSQLERASRPGAELRADLSHDVAEQRAGLGTIYAELASDAVKAKDLDRARRLLATAAHLDPGNRSRYEQQLLAFDKSAALPRDTSAPAPSAGSAKQGATP